MKWHGDEPRSPLWIGGGTDASDGANGRCELLERATLMQIMSLIQRELNVLNCKIWQH